RPYLFSLTLSSYYTTLHPLLHSFPTRRSSDLTVPAFTSRETWSRAFTPGKVFVMSTILSRTSFGIVRSSFYIGRGMSSGSENGKDRKSTRLNSSHVSISYAVFCLKKKKDTIN